MTPLQQAQRVMNAVSLGWQVPDEALAGYAVAEMRTIDVYQRFWQDDSTLKDDEYAQTELETASDLATSYIAGLG